MRTITATEAARNFSGLLDSLDHGGEEIVVVRNHRPVAKLVPFAPRRNAMEVLGNLYGTLSDAGGESWLKDIESTKSTLVTEH